VSSGACIFHFTLTRRSLCCGRLENTFAFFLSWDWRKGYSRLWIFGITLEISGSSLTAGPDAPQKGALCGRWCCCLLSTGLRQAVPALLNFRAFPDTGLFRYCGHTGEKNICSYLSRDSPPRFLPEKRGTDRKKRGMKYYG